MIEMIETIGAWKNNAELIADAASLGYIHGDILDATYGLGRFWSLLPEVEPSVVKNDADPERGDFHSDFCSFPKDWQASFDTTIFDPPYKLNGTPSLPMDNDYGANVATTLKDKLSLIENGAIECLRVTRSKGYLLVKVMDQVASGRMWWQTDLVTQALSESARKVAVFHLKGRTRKQPAGRRQLHPRNTHSTLMVFKKN